MSGGDIAPVRLQRSDAIRPGSGCASSDGQVGEGGSGGGAAEELEELGVHREDDDSALGECLFVRLQRALECVELWGSLECIGVDLQRLGVAFAPNLL